MGKPSMKRRRNGDSDYEGDLVDPSVDGSDPHASASPNSQPNAHSPVYVGGGEREARAYVAPTAVPLIAAPKTSADKVAIASSVDPRRMQTIRLSPGRIRPPLTPDEQRPEMPAEEADPINEICPLLERYPELAPSRVQMQPPTGSNKPVRFKQCRTY